MLKNVTVDVSSLDSERSDPLLPALSTVRNRGARRTSSAVPPRTTHEVFYDHLGLRALGEVQHDIARNYARDVVLLTSFGVFHGHRGVRRCATMLKKHIGDARVTWGACFVHGDVVFYEWHAHSDTICVEDGADTFIVRDGLIVAKTIHYTVRPIGAAASAAVNTQRD
jgi:hypothetical protein